MPDVWLSGRAVGVSGPWPSAELSAEERRTLYGGVPSELPPERATLLGTVAKRVLAELAAGPVSARELVGRIGCASTTYRAIMRLRRAGRIERVGGRLKDDGAGGRRGYGGRWALATRQGAAGCP